MCCYERIGEEKGFGGTVALLQKQKSRAPMGARLFVV